MKFSTLAFAVATFAATSFAQADESQFAPQPMSMKSRAEVRAEAHTDVAVVAGRGDVGYTFIDSRQPASMSTLTRDEVRAKARSGDSRSNGPATPETLGSVGGM